MREQDIEQKARPRVGAWRDVRASLLMFWLVSACLTTLGLFHFSQHGVNVSFDRPVSGVVRIHYSPSLGSVRGTSHTFSFWRQIVSGVDNTGQVQMLVPRLPQRLRFVLQLTPPDARIERIVIGSREFLPEQICQLSREGGEEFYQPSPMQGPVPPVQVFDLDADVGLSLWWLPVCWCVCFLLAVLFAQGLRQRAAWGAFLQRHRTAACVFSVMASFLYVLVRFSDRLKYPKFFWEDGLVFYRQAYDEGVKTLFWSYAGYLHSYQRVIALLAQWVDIMIAPQFYIVFALLAQLLFYMAVWADTNRVGVFGKILLTLALVLVPTSGDPFLILTNSMWVMGVGLVLLMLSDPPSSKRQWLFHSFYLVVSGLSGTFSILFAPMFAVRYLLLRKQLPKTECYRMLIFLAVAGTNFIASPIGVRPAEFCTDAWQWIELFKNLALPYFLGVLEHFRHPMGISVLILSIGLVASLLPLIFNPELTRRELLDRVAFAFCGGIILATSLWKWRDRPQVFVMHLVFDRYYFVIYCCLSFALIRAIVTQARGRWARLAQAAAAAVLLASAFYSVLNAGQKRHWHEGDHQKFVEEFHAETQAQRHASETVHAEGLPEFDGAAEKENAGSSLNTR